MTESSSTALDRQEHLLYAIAPTQFDRTGALDLAAMTENLGALAEQGIVDVLLTGAYGEFQSLDDDERCAITSAVASVSTGRIMACAAKTSTVATANLAGRLVEAGAHEVMVSPPLLAEVTDADVMRHFEVLSQRVEADLVVYNNPIFGIDLSREHVEWIASLPNVVAIKQGSRDPDGVGMAVRVAGDKMRVLGASDLRSVDALAAGASGFTSTNSWVFPQAFRVISDNGGTEHHHVAASVRSALAPYAQIVAELGQPRSVKAAMVFRGYSGSAMLRLPYVELDEGERDRLEDAIKQSDELLDGLNL